ncbi:hypothetical protein SDJN02_21404, partial [Cucurbita argyrosperma subsp. argyrosperma]
MAALTDFCRDSGDISTRNDLNTSPEMLKPSSASSDDVSPNSRGKSSDSGINMEGTAGDRAFAFEEVVRTQASGGCVDPPRVLKHKEILFVGVNQVVCGLLLLSTCLETSEYPLSQGIFWVVDGQNDPSEQKISPLRPTSAHMFAPPQLEEGSS